MDTQNQEIHEEQSVPVQEIREEQAASVRKKKKGPKLIIFFLVLVLVIGGGTAYYFMERQKPQNTVKNFLACMQNMDFDGMGALLQSNDLSALDNADIRNDAYTAFFEIINKKMTYKLTKTDFSIQNGTANVTAHIKYIDGTDIYKETITEFLRQIVSTAFSGKELTEDQIEQTLASILQEKSGTVEDNFAEIDITYPLISANGVWKIVALDDETVKIMSANFKNVEDEINQSLADMDETDNTDAQEVPSATAEDSIDMSNDKFTIHYTQHRVSKDFAGGSCLLVYYDYTNNGTSASSAMVDVSMQAYQNGKALSAAIPETNEDAIDKFMSEIQPGQTVNVCQAFSLNDTSDVTLQAGEAFSFGGGTVNSQILKIK